MTDAATNADDSYSEGDRMIRRAGIGQPRQLPGAPMIVSGVACILC